MSFSFSKREELQNSLWGRLTQMWKPLEDNQSVPVAMPYVIAHVAIPDEPVAICHGACNHMQRTKVPVAKLREVRRGWRF